MFVTDEQEVRVWDDIRQQDSRLLGKHLTTEVLDEAARRAEITIGKSPLQAANLVWLGILAACFPNKDFSSVLCMTLKLLADQQGFGQTAIGRAQHQGQRRKSRRKSNKKSGSRKRRPRSKHDPRQDDPTVVSVRKPSPKHAIAFRKQFWMELLKVLNEGFESVHGDQLCWKRFRFVCWMVPVSTLDGWKRFAEALKGAAGRGKGTEKDTGTHGHVAIPFGPFALCLRRQAAG